MVEQRIVGMAGGLLRHALGFMLLGWRRMLRGALIAAAVTILVTEIAAMVASHSLLPGAPAQLVAAALAFAVAYITALTIFIWELAAGLIDLIRVAEGEVEAGARAVGVIAEREIGEVGAGLRRLVGLSAHPQPRSSAPPPASPIRPGRALSPSRARAAVSANHPDAIPTAETLAALAPLAARAVAYHNRQQQQQQAVAAPGAVAGQPNVASVTQLPPLPMNPVPATNLPRIEWTYEQFAVTPPAPTVSPPVEDESLEDAPLVEPAMAPDADEPAATEAPGSPVADAASAATVADAGQSPATTGFPSNDATDRHSANAASPAHAAGDDPDDEPGDVADLRAALHLTPLAAYVAPMAAPLAELASGAIASAFAHRQTAVDPVATHSAVDAPVAAAPTAATTDPTIPDAPDDAVAADVSDARTAVLPDASASFADDDADDDHQTQPDLPIVSARTPATTQPAAPADLGAPSAATQPLPGANITRPIVRATSPLTRPRSEQSRATRPVTRPLPAQSGPRPNGASSGGAGLWERLSQALVGRTPPPTAPRPAAIADTITDTIAAASADASAMSDTSGADSDAEA